MDDLPNLSRAELEQLCRGLRATAIRLQAQARRDTEEMNWLMCQVRVYRRLAEKLLREQEEHRCPDHTTSPPTTGNGSTP